MEDTQPLLPPPEEGRITWFLSKLTMLIKAVLSVASILLITSGNLLLAFGFKLKHAPKLDSFYILYILLTVFILAILLLNKDSFVLLYVYLITATVGMVLTLVMYAVVALSGWEWESFGCGILSLINMYFVAAGLVLGLSGVVILVQMVGRVVKGLMSQQQQRMVASNV